jgi:hypothetical protein
LHTAVLAKLLLVCLKVRVIFLILAKAGWDRRRGAGVDGFCARLL